MFNVFLTLVAGLVSQLLSNSFLVRIEVYSYSYDVYILTVASIYLSSALCCVKLAVAEVNNQRNISAILISALCLCMLITALFNIAMIDRELFYIFNEYKSGDGISWKNIYLAIELSIIILVIYNGLNYVFNFSLCTIFGNNRINNINQSNIKGK